MQSYAQSNNIRLRHINVENGLSSNTVWSVAQDNDGFMWFGTNNGLSKYDGNNFSIYRSNHKDTLSLSNSRIIDLLAVENGDLWVGTADGLNCYQKDKDQFLRFDPPAFEFNYIRCLYLDHKGRLWIGSTDGLYQFDISEKAFVHRGIFPEKPYAFLDRNIVNINEDKNETLWISTTQGLYILRDGVISNASVMGSHPLLSSKEQFRDVLEDDIGNYWIATESLEEGVFYFDKNLRLIDSYTNIKGQVEILAGNRVRMVRQLSDGKIWFGSFDGLSVFDYDNGVFNTYKTNKYDANSLSHNSVRDIFEDRDGGIWVATYRGGVNYYHPEFHKFNHVKEEVLIDNSLSDNLVSVFTQDKNGDLWIGTDDGLNFLDVSENRFTNFYREEFGKGLLDNAIKDIQLDHKNNIWIGSQRGLSYLDILNNEFQHFIHDPTNVNSIGYGHVESIYQDKLGTTWIGINGSGLNRYIPEQKSFERFSEIEGKLDERVDIHINTIVKYNDDLLWIGTEGGLEIFDKTSKLFTRVKLIEDSVFESVTRLHILTLYFDNEGHLWIGTIENGLLIYDTNLGEIYDIDDQVGFSSNTVNGILEDPSGNIWVSTDNGISKLIKPENGWDTFTMANLEKYNITDGLQGLQFYPNSAYKAQDGQLYFGGANGYNSFFPKNVVKSDIQPDVVFTNIRFRGNPTVEMNDKTNFSRNDTISISYQQSDFSVEFSALNYFDPKQTIYSYKMEPFDQDWNVIGNERVVNYSKLPPGDYIFKVRATNNILNWGESFSQLSIRIIPPYWRAWWAYTIYLLLLAALLYLFFRYATKLGTLKSDLAWEHLEREKEQEQHQMRIKFFTDISHELRTPLTLILAPLERLLNQYAGSTRSRNQLLLIQRNGERMLHLINQLLDLRKLETGHLNLHTAKGNIVKFINEVSLAFKEITSQKNINYNIYTGQEEIAIWFDRDKMEIILYNLLSNAVKYTSEGGSIGLSLRAYPKGKEEYTSDIDMFSEGYVEIRVEDDGIGIPSENLDKIFDRFYRYDGKTHGMVYGSGVGLEIVKKFVDLHKGSISVNSIESTTGQRGKTIFAIKLPMGRDHLSDADIIEDFRTSEDISLYKNSSMEPDIDLEESISAPASLKENLGEDESRATLLIVEDNDEVRKFIVNLFDGEYGVIEASNGEEGMELAFDGIPDIIISDIMMPGIDGIELCKKIKSDNRTSHIPIILLTARTAVTFQIEGIETGADDYITKPFSSHFLKSRVKKLIEQRQNLRIQFGKGAGLIPENISVTSVDEKLMEKTIGYINEHIADPELRVEKVASEVGMSRGHFYRKIKALTNLSAVEFIKVIRLERAAQLLKTGKLNISEVRYAVGINDADYFRESFKIHYGVIPSDYVQRDSPSVSDENLN